jgi:hypothetical protein
LSENDLKYQKFKEDFEKEQLDLSSEQNRQRIIMEISLQKEFKEHYMNALVFNTLSNNSELVRRSFNQKVLNENEGGESIED